MPGFKDFVNGTTLPESDLDDFLGKQVVMKFASVAARTAALAGVFRAGIVSYLDDLRTLAVNTGATDVHSTIGPIHGALTPWLPSLVQSGAVTYNVVQATYARVGRMVFFYFNANISGTGVASNIVTLALPFAAVNFDVDTVVGEGYIYDNSAALAYPGIAILASASTLALLDTTNPSNKAYQGGGTGTFGAALAANDTVTVHGWYEAAADA